MINLSHVPQMLRFQNILNLLSFNTYLRSYEMIIQPSIVHNIFLGH